MLIEKGDTVLYIVYHAPYLKGIDIGLVTNIEILHKRKFYEIEKSNNLYRQDQIILKFTKDQLIRYHLINEGPIKKTIQKIMEA